MDSLHKQKRNKSGKHRGRPPAESPRSHVIKVRATPSENIIIKDAAAAARMPIATFLRTRALSSWNFPLPRLDIEAAAQLAQIGEAFDQAVRLCEDGQLPDWPGAEMTQLRDLCRELSVNLVQVKHTESNEKVLE